MKTVYESRPRRYLIQRTEPSGYNYKGEVEFLFWETINHSDELDRAIATATSQQGFYPQNRYRVVDTEQKEN